MLTIPLPIPIRIHPLFWVLALAVGYLNSGTIEEILILFTVVVFSVLVHELGHALVAYACSLRPVITLYWLGGMTSVGNSASMRPWQEFLMVLMGPLFGLFLACTGLWFWRAGFSEVLFASIFLINGLWTLLNLLPIHPMDGAKLVSIPLEKYFGVNGVKISYGLSLLTAIAATFIAFHAGYLTLGAIFFLFALESQKGLKKSLAFSRCDENGVVQRLWEEGEALREKGHIKPSAERYLEITKRVRKGAIRARALARLAEKAKNENNYSEAAFFLNQVPKGDVAIEEMRLDILFKMGKYVEALKVGASLFKECQYFEVAAIMARCAQEVADTNATRGWLQMAKELDPVKGELLEKEIDFSPRSAP